MRTDDVVLIPLPLNHSFGLRVLRAALYNGETIYSHDKTKLIEFVKNNIYGFHEITVYETLNLP